MPLRHRWKKDSAEKFSIAHKTPKFDHQFDNIIEANYEKSMDGCTKFNNEIIDLLTSIADSVIPKCKRLPNRLKKTLV